VRVILISECTIAHFKTDSWFALNFVCLLHSYGLKYRQQRCPNAPIA
jgi:hypothetical protein